MIKEGISVMKSIWIIAILILVNQGCAPKQQGFIRSPLKEDSILKRFVDGKTATNISEWLDDFYYAAVDVPNSQSPAAIRQFKALCKEKNGLLYKQAKRDRWMCNRDDDTIIFWAGKHPSPPRNRLYMDASIADQDHVFGYLNKDEYYADLSSIKTYFSSKRVPGKMPPPDIAQFEMFEMKRNDVYFMDVVSKDKYSTYFYPRTFGGFVAKFNSDKEGVRNFVLVEDRPLVSASTEQTTTTQTTTAAAAISPAELEALKTAIAKETAAKREKVEKNVGKYTLWGVYNEADEEGCHKITVKQFEDHPSGRKELYHPYSQYKVCRETVVRQREIEESERPDDKKFWDTVKEISQEVRQKKVKVSKDYLSLVGKWRLVATPPTPPIETSGKTSGICPTLFLDGYEWGWACAL